MTIRPISEFNPDNVSEDRPNIRPIEEFVPEESTLSQIGTQLAGGVVSDIPRMTGQALQAFSPKDSTVAKFGKEMSAAAEERGKEYAPRLENKNEFENALISGSRSIPASVATMAAYAVPGAGAVLGPAATVGLYGGSQYQDTYDKIKAAGGSDEEAHLAGIKTGLIQGGGELVANKLSMGLLGAGKKVAGEGVKGVLGKAADTSVVKPFLKSYAKAMVGEPATEIAQDVGTELVERQGGAPETPISDIAYQSGTAALGMTTILAPFGLGGHYANSRIAEHVNTALDDPSKPAEYRLATVEHLYDTAKKAGATDADAWLAGAVEDISKGAPVRRDTDQVPAAPVLPQEPLREQPEQRPEPVDEDRVKSFVDRYQAAIDKGGVPTVVTAPLRTAAQVAGVYDPNDAPDVMFQKLKGFVYPESPVDTATRELKEKLDAAPVKGVANRAALAAVEAGQAAEQQLPEYPSGMPEPDLGAELTKMSDKQLSNMFQQASGNPEIRTAIKDERARRDASTIRSDTGLPDETGQVGTGSEVDSSSNVYLPQQGPLEGGETIALGDTQQEPQALPEIEEPNVQSENQAPQETSPLEKARAELAGYGGLDALKGPKNAEARARLMATITGDESWATKKVPLTRLQKEFKTATPETPIDFAAQNHAAASPHNEIQEAAKPEDNRKAFTQFQNLPVEIENPAGTTRSGTDESGKPWSITMKDNYGAFTGFKGADKDNVDVFIPQGLTKEQIENTKSAFVVDQINPETGKFDEHKVVIGVPDAATAKEVYLRNYEPGWKGLGAITEMPIPKLEQWLGSDKTAEPVSKSLVRPIHPAEVHAKEETEKLKSELVQAGVDPKIVDSVAKNYQERRVKERATDMVTGFNMASDQKPTIERAIQSGQTAHYIEADVINLGGINAYFKDHAEPANAVLRGITDIFQEAAQSAGTNAIMFRQGGDEVSAVVLGGTNESVEAAIEQAKNKANEFIAKSGLADIPHAKGKPIKGSGLHIGYSEITPAKNYSQITKEASVALNASKTKKAAPIEEIALASRPNKQWAISSEAVPEEKRAGLRGLVNKNAMSISEQLAALTNAGKAYVGPLQFTMNEDKSFTLKDNSEKSDDAAVANRKAATEFMNDFGGSNAQSLFADLDPANSQKVKDAAKAEIANMPNAERIQFVEDNFYDLLLELDESGKVKIKC
jgi:GGDEF domain-containing protein